MLMQSHDTHKDKLFAENKGNCLFIVFLRTTFLSTVLKACILSITIYTLAQYVLKMRLMKRLAFTFFIES